MCGHDGPEYLGYCGLSCTRCQGYGDGEIKAHAQELGLLLQNFDGYAQRFSAFWPVFGQYPAFMALLEHFAQASCQGCHSGQCPYVQCQIKTCAPEKGVEFCGQCPDFPCDHTGLDANLQARWLKMNQRIREIGPEAYRHEQAQQPRYIQNP